MYNLRCRNDCTYYIHLSFGGFLRRDCDAYRGHLIVYFSKHNLHAQILSLTLLSWITKFWLFITRKRSCLLLTYIVHQCVNHRVIFVRKEAIFEIFYFHLSILIINICNVYRLPLLLFVFFNICPLNWLRHVQKTYPC